MQVFDTTPCMLGEGPLWHPLRNELFWFDINGCTLYARSTHDPNARHWTFDEHYSAAAWIDHHHLLMASETALWRFEIATGKQEKIIPLEAENPITRSNDGRADPQGGFWIGTMGKKAEVNAGAIYRYYRGELRKLYSDIRISNAICFAPSGDLAYFCDTPTKQIMRVSLDDRGWPSSEPEVFLDFRGESFGPDGAVVDRQGNLWNAQWGASRVAVYSVQGHHIASYELPTPHASCPAFGGENLSTLFVTTALIDLPPENQTGAGQLYSFQTEYQGQAEHQIKL